MKQCIKMRGKQCVALIEREIEAEYMETRSFLEIVSVSLIYGSLSICMRMIQFSQSKTRIERIFSGER